MKVREQLNGQIVTLELSGKVMAGEDLTSFQGLVQYYLGLNKNRFVIDFKGVDWMSSAGLGAMITAYTSVKKADGRLALANITNIQNLLNITQLTRIFDTYDSRAEAIKAVEG
jgi:anti-sigma B factor antagonist